MSKSFILVMLQATPDLLFRLLINADIDAMIQRGEERTMELNSNYEGLNLEDLSNFNSVASVQQWEGEDFRSGVGPFWFEKNLLLPLFQRKALNFNIRNERKSNYSVDNYFKETLRAGPSSIKRFLKSFERPRKSLCLYFRFLNGFVFLFIDVGVL